MLPLLDWRDPDLAHPTDRRRQMLARLGRIERLREVDAPAWVVKWEQVQLAVIRHRLRGPRVEALRERYVYPRMIERLQ